MRYGILILGTSLLGLVPACGGATSPGASPGGTADAGPDSAYFRSAAVQTACELLAEDRCSTRDGCTNGMESRLQYGTAADCVKRVRVGCVSSLGAPGTGSTPDRVTQCANEVAAQSCASLLDGPTPAQCLPASGSVAVSGACAYNAQCASQYCAIPRGGACGACAPLPKAGDSCAATLSCGPALDCTADTRICVEPVALGGACGTASTCGRGLSCVGAKGASDGTCQALGAAAGVACDPKEQAAPRCDARLALSCDASAGKCAPAALVAGGEPCGTLDTGEALCDAGGKCERAKGAKSGVCAAAIPDGSPCALDTGGTCIPPARCVLASGATTGTCALPDAAACQ